MEFDALFAQVLEALQREQRISYRALRRRFHLSDDDLEDLKVEMIEAKHLAVDEHDRILVWTGVSVVPQLPRPSPQEKASPPPSLAPEREPLSYTPKHLAEKILTSRSALEGERKQVTVLFCDLANSTPIAEHLGPEAMHTLLNRFFALALGAVHRYEGTINQFLGDGFMALFGAPIAHKDHARRGVLSVLALQRTLQETDLGQPYGGACAFRMGLNSGLVVVGSIGDNLRMDYSAIGDTTNLASRLEGIAAPGDIVVSESTSQLVQGTVRLQALQPVQVKGKTEPVSIYKVVGTLPRRSPIVSRSERTLSQFVGRERELATLDDLFAQVESGQGQVLGVVAEAGSGKSRLLYEFRQRLQDKRITYLEGRCLSYGSTIPYHPIIDMIRNNCAITETDSPEAVRDKVRFALHEVGMDSEEFAPYVLQLLGIKEGTESIAMFMPEAVRTRTFETLRQMSLQGSRQRPLIMETEDLHWCDKTSEDFLVSLVESLAGASLMLLTTYRPGYRPPWMEKSYATQLSLRSLASHDAFALVRSHSQHTAMPEHLAQTIVQKAEGNPFFLEELTRTVLEHGDFLAETTVPDTIQGVLSARIDRLSAAQKRLLQTASVLGREFSSTLLRELWDGPEALESVLSELKRLEFFYERTTAEEPLYVFKHALTQDVAYESLLTTRRQALHTAAGQTLEALYTGRLEEVYDHLAYHYARADETIKAVDYLSRVADRAAGGFAHTEAITALQEALAHAERLPVAERERCVAKLFISQITSLFWSGHRQKAIDLHYTRQKRLEQLQDHALVGRYYVWLGMHYIFLGERERAVQSAHRALEEAQQCHDEVTMGMAYARLGLEEIFAGQLVQGVEHGRQGVALLEQEKDDFQLGFANQVLAYGYCFIGNFTRALEVLARMETLAETIGDRRNQTCAEQVRGLTLALRGDCEVSISACEHALELSPDPFETALTLGYLGYAYLEQGNLAEAIPTLERAVQEAMRYRSRQVQCWFKTHLGEAYRLDEHIEKARDFASQGFSLATNIQNPWGVGLAQRTLGRIAHSSGNLAEAATSLQDALHTFSAMQAQYDLARTHLDLAALAHTQGNQDAATTQLSTAHAWFKKLQVPRWVEKTEQFAREYGVTLTGVALEVLTEEPS